MEAVGLAISLAALVSVFETAVDGFQYVQLGKQFGTDAQTAWLKLDNAQLRLSRWGEAIGLTKGVEEAESLQSTLLTPEAVQRAEDRLGHIVNLFKKAEATSNALSSKAGSAHGLGALEDDNSKASSLHQRMRDLCRRRQRNTSFGKKAKWAIFEREQFNRLMEDIKTLVDDLVDLFPAGEAGEAELRQLCDEEAKTFRGEAALPDLQSIAAEQDVILEKAIARLDAQVSTATIHIQLNACSQK